MEEKVQRKVDGGKNTEKYPGKGGSLKCLKSQFFFLRRRERKIFEKKYGMQEEPIMGYSFTQKKSRDFG